MDNETFEASVKNTVDTFTSTLFKKNAGYASDEDRLHNFKAAGIAQGITPEQALRGMTTKHTISINDLVWRGGDDVPMEVWKEKIGDEFNYLIFLMALIEEREVTKIWDASTESLAQKGMDLSNALVPEEWTEKVLDSNKVAVKNPLVEEPAYLERVRASLNKPFRTIEPGNIPDDVTIEEVQRMALSLGNNKLGYLKSTGQRLYFDYKPGSRVIDVVFSNGVRTTMTIDDINYHGEVIS